jgi:hypothetical protein
MQVNMPRRPFLRRPSQHQREYNGEWGVQASNNEKMGLWETAEHKYASSSFVALRTSPLLVRIHHITMAGLLGVVIWARLGTVQPREGSSLVTQLSKGEIKLL